MNRSRASVDTKSRKCTLALRGSHPFSKYTELCDEIGWINQGFRKHAGNHHPSNVHRFLLQILNISFQQQLRCSTNSASNKFIFQDTLPPPNMEPKMGGMSLASLSPAAAVAFKTTPRPPPKKCISYWHVLFPEALVVLGPGYVLKRSVLPKENSEIPSDCFVGLSPFFCGLGCHQRSAIC